MPTPPEASTYATYRRHYERVGNQPPSAVIIPELARVDAWRPWMDGLSRDARILDCGCGYGHQLLALKYLGFTNLHGIEIAPESLEVAARELGNDAALSLEDALEFLPRHEAEFDVVFLNDVLEHFPREQTIPFLRLVRGALRPGGILHVRVPNMSSLLGGYSMYLDVTHVAGFTEYSLMQAFDLAGFEAHRLVSSRPALFWLPRRPGRMMLRAVRLILWAADFVLHRAAYILRAQLPLPRETSFNVEVYTRKPRDA